MNAVLVRLKAVAGEASRAADDAGAGEVPGELPDRVTQEVRRAAAHGASPDEIAEVARLSVNWVRSVLGVRDAPLRDRLGHTIWLL